MTEQEMRELDGRIDERFRTMTRLDASSPFEIRKIKFKGEPFILACGAIATEDAYRDGECSFAHLFPDGTVRRLGRVIGNQDDIEIGEVVDIEMTPEGVDRLWKRLEDFMAVFMETYRYGYGVGPYWKSFVDESF